MKWVKTQFLGQGSYGSVSLAKPLFNSTEFSPDHPSPVLAVKSSAIEEASSLVDEGKFLYALRGSPQILSCFGEDVSFEDGRWVYNLLLEYAPGGTLADLINARRGTLMPEYEVSMYAHMLLMGLQHIHTSGFVHCDLKPANILVFPESKSGIAVNRLKIADLDLAKRAGCPGDVMMYQSTFYLRGTPHYSSPESVLNGVNEPPLDIWSLGIILIEVFSEKSPYSGCDSWGSILDQISWVENLPEMPKFVSKNAVDFLMKCLKRDPRERWTAGMLLNHPFIVDCYNKFFPERKALMSWEGEPISCAPWRSRQSTFSTSRSPIVPTNLAAVGLCV